MKKTGWYVWMLLVIFSFAGPVSAQSVPKALLEQDLAYVVKTVSEVHPELVKADMKRALTARAASLIQALPSEVPRWRVGVTVAELLRVVNDAHTSTDMTFGSSRYLPLQFAWLSDGLIVAPVTGSKVDIPVASEVLKVGDLDTAALERKLARLVSKNRYWVREIGARNLSAESVLRWLGVVANDVVTLTLRTPAGEVEAVEVKLSGYGKGTSQDMQELLSQARGLNGDWQKEDNTLAWRINKRGNYARFWLKTFDNTSTYRSEVQKFFQALAGAGVQNLAFSVQQDSGGDSGAMYAFLEHLPKRKLKTFSHDIRFSPVVTEVNKTLKLPANTL